MTIDKLIERAKGEFEGIDSQIHTLETALNDVQSQIASCQGYTPEAAKQRAALRAEETELTTSLAQATADRKDKATAFAQEVALPNMRQIEDNWRNGLQKKYQPKIDKLHQLIHNAKSLHEELREASSTEKDAFRNTVQELYPYLNAEDKTEFERFSLFLTSFSAADYDDPLIVEIMQVLKPFD